MGDTTHVSNSIFSGNILEEASGIIVLWGANGPLNISHSNFDNNTFKNNGALLWYRESKSTSSLLIEYSNFTDLHSRDKKISFNFSAYIMLQDREELNPSFKQNKDNISVISGNHLFSFKDNFCQCALTTFLVKVLFFCFVDWKGEVMKQKRRFP